MFRPPVITGLETHFNCAYTELRIHNALDSGACLLSELTMRRKLLEKLDRRHDPVLNGVLHQFGVAL